MRPLSNSRFKFLNFILIFLLCYADINKANPTNVTNSRRLLRVSEFEDSVYKEDILRLAKIAEIEFYINEDINPCDDFYEFVCSKFQNFYPANKDVSTSILQFMADALKNKIAFVLNTPTKANDTEAVKKTKEFYKSCLNIKGQSENYKSKLLDIIGEFGKMPVLSNNQNWNEETFDWIAMAAKMQQKYGKAALLQFDIAQDYRDSSVNCLYIGQPKVMLTTKSMYADNSTTNKRKHLRATVAATLHKFLDVPLPLAEQTADQIMVLETWLANGMWDGRMEADKMNVPSSILYMQQKYAPTIDIERFVNLTVGKWNGSCVFESVESFQVNMRDLLPEVPKYIIANYLFFMLLYDDFFLSLETPEAVQQTQCQNRVSVYFSKVLDMMIYHHYNIEVLERDINLIFQQLKDVLWHKFGSDELDWMKPKARLNALAKLQAMRLELTTDKAKNLTTEFKDIEIVYNDFIANIRNLLIFRGKQKLARLNQPPRPIEFNVIDSFMPVNIIQENLIKIPMTILQPYFLWTKGYPNSIKFGNLGSVLAHELIHGFDDEGRKFDKHGSQKNWWDPDTMHAFNERKKCFVEQYNQFKFGTNYVRGDVVLAANIADNGGIKLAYDAYMRWYDNIHRVPIDLRRETLAPLKYTNKQLFFISFAQFWCTGVNENLMNLQIANDLHSPNMFRVIGSLVNFPEFSKAFNCPMESRMNPEKKCKIY